MATAEDVEKVAQAEVETIELSPLSTSNTITLPTDVAQLEVATHPALDRINRGASQYRGAL